MLFLTRLLSRCMVFLKYIAVGFQNYWERNSKYWLLTHFICFLVPKLDPYSMSDWFSGHFCLKLIPVPFIPFSKDLLMIVIPLASLFHFFSPHQKLSLQILQLLLHIQMPFWQTTQPA